MLLIDKYAYSNSLKDYNPQAKILLACGGIILPRIFNNYIISIGVTIAMILLTTMLARIPRQAYGKMILLPLSFLIISLITILITINSSDYLVKISLGRNNMGITGETLNTGINLFLTTISSLTSMYFLILTTPVMDIIKVLRRIRLPNLLIELMLLTYRSIFIFLEEATNIYLAQSMKFGHESKKEAVKSLSLLIRSLFTKVLLKHREMNIALECKLYDGEFRLGD